MPTVAELERLDALVRRLTPVASMQRGELIRAEDWNVVVGALIEVARAVLAEAREGIVPDHEHVDQVSIGWMDPRLRALIERGPLSEPTAVSRFDGLERRLVQAVERMGRLEESTREARSIASELANKDEKRATDLNSIRRSVEAIPDAREDVLTLRETLRGIQTDVLRAIEVGEGLEVNGQPFDAAQYDERLRGVEELRDRLTTPEGTLLDAGALEVRLAELINTFVTQDQLDDVLSNRQFELPDDQFATLEDTLTNRLGERFTDDLNRTATELRAEMTQQFGEVDGMVGRAIGDALPGINENVLGTVRSEIAEQVGASREVILATLDEQIGAVESRMLGKLDAQLGGLEERLTADLVARMDSRIAAEVNPLRADIKGLDARTRQNSDAIAELNTRQTAIDTRIEVVARDAAKARQTLQTNVLGEMDRRMQQQAEVYDRRFVEIEDRLQGRIDVAVDDASNSLAARLEQMTAATARREIQIAINQLRGEIREIAREEGSVAMEGIRRAVQTQLDQSFARIPAVVSAEVRTQTANLPELVRKEINLRSGTIPGSGTIIRGGGG